MSSPADFTEAAYAQAIGVAGDRYRFERFGTDCDADHVLWRHDVDLSVHRALRLAEIEADAGVRATYFFMLGGAFYNLFERAVGDRAREILRLGHDLGVHLESFVQPGEGIAKVEAELERDRRILEDLLEAEARAVSFHNPGYGNDALSIDAERIAGLVNAYGTPLRERYGYVSDSNGYWRHRSLEDALGAGEPRLQVLTHPGWWQAEEMTPRARVARCVEGRARATLSDYDALLADAGRENR